MALPTLVQSDKRLLKLSLHEVGTESRFHEGLRLFLRKLAIFARIVLLHYLIRQFFGCTLLEVKVFLEVCVCIEHYLDVLREVFPRHRVLVSQVFAIDSQ